MIDKDILKSRIDKLYEEESEYNKGVEELNKRINALNNEKHKLRIKLSNNVRYRNVLEENLNGTRPYLRPIFNQVENGWEGYFEEYPNTIVTSTSKNKTSKALWRAYAMLTYIK